MFAGGGRTGPHPEAPRLEGGTRGIHETDPDPEEDKRITAHDYSGLGIPELDVIEVDTSECISNPLNAEAYDLLLDGPERLMASGQSIEALIESVMAAGGNHEPALAVALREPESAAIVPDERTKWARYRLVTGHRRRRACAPPPRAG